MLDEIHQNGAPAVKDDSNSYLFGYIGPHNIVIASLPSGSKGISPASGVAKSMKRSFPWLRIRLMVGIEAVCQHKIMIYALVTLLSASPAVGLLASSNMT